MNESFIPQGMLNFLYNLYFSFKIFSKIQINFRVYLHILRGNHQRSHILSNILKDRKEEIEHLEKE